MKPYYQNIQEYFTGCEAGDKVYDLDTVKSFEELTKLYIEVSPGNTGFKFHDSVENVTAYYNHLINELLTVDMDEELEDLVYDIKLVDGLPSWIKKDYLTDIKDAKNEVENGHGCPDCAGSGEGRFGGRCTSCNGNGAVTYKEIFKTDEF